METFWKWIPRVAGIIAIGSFLKLLLGGNMETIELLWNNLTSWQIAFFVSLFVVIFSLWMLELEKNKAKKTSLIMSSDSDGKIYLVEGKTCSHIPDPETFQYLERFFGFSSSNIKRMPSEDIKGKFVTGRQLPSIKFHFPKHGNTL
jgi:hypothetical protein